MRIRGSARGCWGALVILRELPDRGSEWFPSNVARNSHACILGFEIRSLELQRLWPVSKNDRVKLRATFGGVVTSVTFGPLCQAPPLHLPPLHRLCSSAPPGMQREAGARRVPPLLACGGRAVSARASAQKQRPRTRQRERSVLPPALDGVDRVGAQVGQRRVGVDQAGGQAGGLEARGDVLPVHQVPPSLDVVGLDVEVI